MSTTPYRVHLLGYTLGNHVDDKADVKCLGIYAFVLDEIWGVYAFVLDKICEGDEGKVDMS